MFMGMMSMMMVGFVVSMEMVSHALSEVTEVMVESLGMMSVMMVMGVGFVMSVGVTMGVSVMMAMGVGFVMSVGVTMGVSVMMAMGVRFVMSVGMSFMSMMAVLFVGSVMSV